MTIKERFMHNLVESGTGRKFREAKTVDDVMGLFQVLGYNNIPPEVASRLSFLSIPSEHRNSHFQDALDISEIIDDLVPEDLDEVEVNELRAASLVHDVGKAGPANATRAEQLAIVTLFNLDFPYGQMVGGKRINEVPLKQALAVKVEAGEITQEQVTELLTLVTSASARQEHMRPETTITEDTPIGNFWSAHVYWTYDVLQKTSLPKTLIDTAASHHLLEGHDPAGVGQGGISSGMVSLELADKYQAYRIRLMLADKYQAYIQRSGKTHEETIKIMQARIESFFKDCPDEMSRLRDLYFTILDKIDQKKDVFARELELEK